MIEVAKLDPEAWKEMSRNAHFAVFKEEWDSSLEKISFAYVMSVKGQAVSYATTKEITPTNLYLQYGGAFPDFRDSIIAFRSFKAMIDDIKKYYSKITTYVENTNYPMMKFYMKEKFRITGIRYFKDLILLEHTFEIQH